MLSDFHFLRPFWLLLLPIGFALWWFVRTTTDPLRGWSHLIAPELLNALSIDNQRASRRWDSLSLLGIWTLLTIATSGPTWQQMPSPFDDDPAASIILLSVSESMDLPDLSPSRLERAKLKVRDLVEDLKGTPLGLIAYAGTAHLVLPPTKDSEIVSVMAAELTSDIMPKPGNNLESAIALASSTLPDSQGNLIVIADLPPSDRPNVQLPKNVTLDWLAITQTDAPELGDIQAYCQPLGIKPIALTPDKSDVEILAARLRRAQQSLAAGEGSERWIESSWWLIPFAAALSLFTFRREGSEAS
ncbi:MAG: vWA domain-containing protein [Aureliella sp.]